MMCHRWSQTLDSVSTYFSFNTSDWTYGFGQELCYWAISAGFLLMFILSQRLNELSRLDLTFLKPAALEFAVFLLSFFYLYICLLVYSYWFIWEVWKEHIYTAMLMRSQMTTCRNFGFWGLNSSCKAWKQASNLLGYLGKPQPLQ